MAWFQRRPGGFRRSPRIKDNPAGRAPNEGDIGKVKATDLIDLVLQNLVEAEIQIQSSNSLQRGVDAVEVLALSQELIALDIPGHMAGIGLDLHRVRRRDETLLLLLEIPLVGEVHRGPCLLDNFDRVLRRWFAFGVKMFDFGR